MIRHVTPQPRYKYHAPVYCYPSVMLLSKKQKDRERRYTYESLKLLSNKKRKDMQETLTTLRRELLGIVEVDEKQDERLAQEKKAALMKSKTLIARPSTQRAAVAALNDCSTRNPYSKVHGKYAQKMTLEEWGDLQSELIEKIGDL